MLIPSNHVSECSEGIQDEDLLSLSQIRRARFLELEESRIIEMQQRKIASKRILRELYKEAPAMNYLRSIAHSLITINPSGVNAPSFYEDYRDALWETASRIFTSDVLDQDIPYIVMYYGGNDKIKIERIRYMLIYLHTWWLLGKDHPLFGQVYYSAQLSQQDNEDYNIAYIWQKYTQCFLGSGQAFVLPFSDKDGKIVLGPIYNSIPRERIPKVFSSLGMLERVWNDSKTPPPPDEFTQEIEHLEEIFILQGAALTVTPSPTLYESFTDIYGAKFFKDPKMLPKFEGFTLEINTNTTPPNKNKKRKPANSRRGYTPPKTTQDTIPEIAKEHEPIKQKLTTPSIRGSLQSLIFGGTIVNMSVEQLLDHFPDGALLEVTIDEEKAVYAAGDTITLSEIRGRKTSYVFRFISQDEDVLPSTPLEVEIKGRKPIEATTTTVTDRTHGLLTQQRGPSAPIDSQVLPTQDRDTSQYSYEETIGLAFLDAFESRKPGELPSGCAVSQRGNSTILTYTTPLGVDKSVDIHFSVDHHGEILCRDGDRVLSGVLPLVETELKLVLEEHKMMQKEKQLQRENQYIQSLQTSHDDLVRQMHLLSPIDWTSMDDLLDFCSRKDSAYSLALFIGSKNPELLHQLLTHFPSLHLSYEFYSGRPPKLQITLERDGFTKAILSISTVQGDTHYSIDGLESFPEGEIKKNIEQFVKVLYITIALQGYHLHGYPYANHVRSKKKGALPKRNEPFSSEKISSIIDGTYRKDQYRSQRELSQEERNMIAETLAQFREGRGKILISEGYSHEFGYPTHHIEGKKGCDDISPNNHIVLVDSKVSSRPQGEKGDPNVYSILQHDGRMQKYWILRMISTILGKNYKGKTPFINGLEEVFKKFWNSLSPDTQRQFITEIVGEGGSTQAGINLKREESSDATIYIEFLEAMRNAGIQLTYSRPHTIPSEEFLKNL